MADRENSERQQDVFWANLDMESSGEDAYIPGLSAAGNKRPSRLKARKPKEVKPKIPVSQPVVEDVFSSPDDDRVARQQKRSKVKPKPRQEMPIQVELSCDTERSGHLSVDMESFAERSIRRLSKASASLKDLRPEDKQRVANLIKELAKVGEEKEKVVKELHGERETHERQIITLVEQQEKILTEREDIQTKLFQCQQLLTEYQSQLLNKQDKLNTSIASIREEQRQSRSRESPRIDLHPQSRDQRLYNGHDETDSVEDLLLSNKNPRDNVRLPYTSLIDKEIARERSLSRSSRGSAGSRSRSASPLDGRPKFLYAPKLNGIGPLQDPVASSTHKSMEIKQDLPENDLDSPRSSLRGSSVRGHSPVMDRGQGQGHHSSKVYFNEKTEDSDNAKMHSPNMKNPKMFNDPAYAQYYKKLSPSGRKRELLQQRQALLDEQERLRLVLEKQEKALKLKQYEFDKRAELQKERMEFYRDGGKFPALRLDFDGDSQSETQVNVNIETAANDDRVNRVGGGVNHRNGQDRGGTVGGGANGRDRGRITEEMDVGQSCPDDVEIDDDMQIRSRVCASTSPLVTPRAQKVSMATSPSPPEEDFVTPRFVDAATSISYRTPLKDASNRQLNLPLQANRQKSSPYTKQPVIIDHEDEPMIRTPGEKTLNVLELVNSMEERPPSLNSSYNRPDIENKPVSMPTTRQSTGKYSMTKGSHSSPYRQFGSPSIQRTSHGHREVKEVSMEENRILEDIFFLK